MSTILSKTDDGKQIMLKLGQALTIRLPENPTTGYRWTVDQVQPSDLTPQSVTLENDSYTAETNAGAGGGGVHTFTFKAVKIGATQLQLKLWQRWEQDIADRFHLLIQVEA